MWFKCWIPVFMVWLISGCATTTEVSFPVRGDLVRIWSERHEFTKQHATVEAMGRDSLSVMMLGGRVDLALSDVERVERYIGRHRHTRKGAILGGVGGALVAVAALAAAHSSASDAVSNPFDPADDTEKAAVSGAVALLAIPVGASLGALIGTGIETEHWVVAYPDERGQHSSGAFDEEF